MVADFYYAAASHSSHPILYIHYSVPFMGLADSLDPGRAESKKPVELKEEESSSNGEEKMEVC